MRESLIISIAILLFAYFAFRVQSLTLKGAIMASVVGLMITWSTGLYGVVVMGAFFVSSTFVGRLFTQRTHQHLSVVGKGEQRDALQVFANGGVPTLISVAYAVFDAPIWIWMFTASFAAVTADTWATSFGVCSKNNPINIKTGQRVTPGVSGAVSIAGTFGAVLGSFLIAFTGFIIFQFYDLIIHTSLWFIVITLAGFLGQFVDTIIGAWFQVTFRCRRCGKLTEQTVHCDVRTKQVKGFKAIDNDLVNMICATSSAVIVWLVLFII